MPARSRDDPDRSTAPDPPAATTDATPPLPDRTLPQLLDPARLAALSGPPAAADPPGYRLLGELARGGMGVVYRAVDAKFGREVAVKLVRPEYRADPEAARRFVREARVTGRLQHPGVPPAHDLGELPDGSPLLAM